MNRILITGATGLVGRRLANQLLERGDTVLALSRRPLPKEMAHERCHGIVGDPTQAGPWLESLAQADAVVHLAGEHIFAQRWSENFLKVLHDSRVLSTELIAAELAKQPLRSDGQAKVLLSASAIGYYGADTGDTVLSETTAPGTDAMAKISIAWEKAADVARQAGVRVAHPRIGIVLDPDGGALPRMMNPFKMFVGGRIGSGKQYLSWIHRDDLTHLLIRALDNPDFVGPFNATAPNPINNAEFSRVLGKVMKRPNWLPVPGFALRILLGKVSQAIVGGQNVHPEFAKQHGFAFQYPQLESALRHLLNR